MSSGAYSDPFTQKRLPTPFPAFSGFGQRSLPFREEAKLLPYQQVGCQISPVPQRDVMNTEKVQIVDRGRGLQLSTSRITVLDVFYYLHRGYDFEFIHRAMPGLTREEFDAILCYVKDHHEELVEKDRRAEEFHQQGIEAQRARGGIFAESEENLSTAQRVARLKEKMKQPLAEKNRARHPD
jgi:hypothetical protein